MKKSKFSKFFYYFALIIITLIFLGPLFWMFILAIHPAAGIFTKFELFKPTLENFIIVLKEEIFIKSLIGSITLSLSTTLITIILCFPVSYILARFKIRREKDIGFLFLSGRMTPPIAVILPFLIVLRFLGLIDTFFGMILIYLIPSMAFSVLILVPFIRSIPVEIEEAAKVDGCSYIQTLFKIVLPLSKHGIVIASIFSFLTTWNEFFFTYILTRLNIRTLPVLIQQFLTYTNVHWGEMMATATTVVIPLIIFIFLVQDYLVTGMTMGAVER